MSGIEQLTRYHSRLVALVSASKLIANPQVLAYNANDRPKGRRKTRGGVVYASRSVPLVFKNGSTLNFREVFEVAPNESLERVIYSIHYQLDNDHYFRYERDSEAYRPFVHEEYHLHVNSKAPRYKTHATNFEEVFRFILGCYHDKFLDDD